MGNLERAEWHWLQPDDPRQEREEPEYCGDENIEEELEQGRRIRWNR
jgi:hypothetical protein